MARKQWEVQTNCVSAGLRRGRRAVAAPKEAQSAIRVPGGSRSCHQEPRGPLRLGPLTILPPPLLQDSAISPDSGGGRGGRGLRPLPLFPALPSPAQRDRARPGPAQPLSTHGSDCSGGSSPAPASPPPTPGRSSAAGSEPRGAWRVGTRGAFAPGTGSCAWPRLLAAGALLGAGRFGVSVGAAQEETQRAAGGKPGARPLAPASPPPGARSPRFAHTQAFLCF